MRIRKNPDERKAEILKAAFELFGSQGFLKTSIQNIVDAVGISKATFFHYFKTKDDLLKEIILSHIVEFIIKADFSLDKPFLENTQRFVDTLFADMQDKKLMDLSIETNQLLDNQILLYMHEAIKPFHTKLIEQGITEGICKIEPEDKELCIIALQEIVCVTWRLYMQTKNGNVRKLFTIPTLERILHIPSNSLH